MPNDILERGNTLAEAPKGAVDVGSNDAGSVDHASSVLGLAGVAVVAEGGPLFPHGNGLLTVLRSTGRKMESNKWRKRCGIASVWLATLLWCMQGAVLAASERPSAIGHLGGIPVVIPSPYARFLEYDGDPNFMERRTGPKPVRTFQSGISGFAFEVHFPDMTVLDPDNHDDARKETIRTTRWMRVLVDANTNFGTGGDTALERAVESLRDPKRRQFPYRRLQEQTYGLTGYAPIVESSASSVWTYASSSNVYIRRDDAGRVTTFIECGNASHAAERCQQRFLLRPGLRVSVSVNFRRELLSHWMEIQDSVTATILGFKANALTTNSNE